MTVDGCDIIFASPHHAQDVEALVRREQVHVEEVFEAHFVVRLLVVLVLVHLFCHQCVCMYVCMYVCMC